MSFTLEGFLNFITVPSVVFMAGLLVSLGWQAGIRMAEWLFGKAED